MVIHYAKGQPTLQEDRKYRAHHNKMYKVVAWFTTTRLLLVVAVIHPSIPRIHTSLRSSAFDTLHLLCVNEVTHIICGFWPLSRLETSRNPFYLSAILVSPATASTNTAQPMYCIYVCGMCVVYYTVYTLCDSRVVY